MKTISVFLTSLFVFVFVGCGTYVLTTDDVKTLVVDGSLTVATLTIRSNVTMPVVIDAYPFTVNMDPSDTLYPGGIIRLAYRTFARSNRSHHIELAAIPIGRTREGLPLQSAKIGWDFYESDWQGTNQVVYVLEQTSDASAVYFR